MPCEKFTTANGKPGWLLCSGQHKPGSQPPAGYSDWCDWAAVQEKAGLKQQQCSVCQRWKFPQQMSEAKTEPVVAYTSKLDAQRGTNPINSFVQVLVCKDCSGGTP